MNMSRKLIVTIRQLQEGHRSQIRAVAAAHGFKVHFFENNTDSLPALADAEVIFGQSALLAKNAPRLRWLCTPSAGVNQFTAPGLFASEDAVLTNSSGAYGVTIAEHIVMVTLTMMRRQQEYAEIVARLEWKRDLAVRSIRDSRITILGTGDIGRETAVRLRAFSPAWIIGMNRGGHDPLGLFDRVLKQDQLPDVLPKTDLLILCLPGTPETKQIINEERLATLPDGALIVNVGRGDAIDQSAIERELRTGRLYAALDVFQQEPLPKESSLWGCPNLLITPHIAGNMTLDYTLDRIVALFLEDFENYCEGRPLLRKVDLKQGY
jgi:phosphoglycerate dehydrogenase-like enzyme